MQKLIAVDGVSHYTNVDRLAQEVILKAPVVTTLGKPAVYPHLVQEEHGARLVVETAEPDGGYELVMPVATPAKSKLSLEYFVKRVQARGFAILDSAKALTASLTDADESASA